MKHVFLAVAGVLLAGYLIGQPQRPNIILVMADDQGWGQVGYYDHPSLKTPNLDAMAASGLRFDRFYAAGPVCSPTRASVLTGRTPKRTGVPSHGHNLCLQEKTLPQALKSAGYTTAHFGKWHLNGVRGAGVPVLKDDPNHPGHYGFDEWLSVTNFFDRDPLMSRNGEFEAYNGDGSEVIVEEALKYISDRKEKNKPFFAVIWFGSPHSPWDAVQQDKMDFPPGNIGNHLGELVALDRSIGNLRKGMRELGIEKNTLIWYCSDNSGLEVDPNSVRELRGHKGDVFEGGIRVPGIIEWSGHIEPAITDFPASTMDIMPTVVDLLNLPGDVQLKVRDGESILPLFKGETPDRKRPIPFYFQNQVALIDGDYKILTINERNEEAWELYNLVNDKSESENLAKKFPERFMAMKEEAKAVVKSIEASANGRDYPEGETLQPARREFWFEMEVYKPHFETFFERPVYKGYQKRANDYFNKKN